MVREKGLKIRRKLPDGRVIIYHPMEDRFLFLHRFLKERGLGRRLNKDEVVYFRNNNFADLRIGNLGLAKQNDWIRQRKCRLIPTPSRIMLWALYKPLHLSGVTLSLFYGASTSSTYSALKIRGIQLRTVDESRRRIWRVLNKTVRKIATKVTRCFSGKNPALEFLR